MLMSPTVISQEDESGDEVTKYTIKEYLEANLPPQDGRLIVLDEITGLMTITDTKKNQDLALQLIREWDVGPKQIQIEAKFIEITFTDLDEMGVDWNLVTDGKPQLALVSDASAGEQTLFGTATTSALAFADAANTAGAGILIGKTALTGTQLLAYLKALTQSGKANLLNAPRVTTLSGQMANIQVVRSFPYATSVERTLIDLTSSTGGTTDDVFPVETYEVEEEITGIILEVTPSVSQGSDIITMDIHPEVTQLIQQIDLTESTTFPEDLGWPIIDTRTAQSSVMVRSGQTILLGGLIQDADTDTVDRKVPFLGDLPLLGNLFRYEYENREKKNLVVFITAKLISTRGDEIE